MKYSHERLSDLPEMNVESNPQLLVETLGDSGLRYRLWKPGQRPGRWVESKAIPVDGVKDTAGAGDWCSAGLMSKIASSGLNGFSKLTDQELSSAIRYGQALSSWCCRFEGARGGMYEVTKEQFTAQVKEILQGAPVQLPISKNKAPIDSVSSAFCRQCDQSGTVASQAKARKAR